MVSVLVHSINTMDLVARWRHGRPMRFPASTLRGGIREFLLILSEPHPIFLNIPDSSRLRNGKPVAAGTPDRCP